MNFYEKLGLFGILIICTLMIQETIVQATPTMNSPLTESHRASIIGAFIMFTLMYLLSHKIKKIKPKTFKQLMKEAQQKGKEWKPKTKQKLNQPLEES